jgi:hypothetical protein
MLRRPAGENPIFIPHLPHRWIRELQMAGFYSQKKRSGYAAASLLSLILMPVPE